MDEVLIYGTGGSAREVAWLASCTRGAEACRVVGFVDDDPSRHGTTLRGVPVLGLVEAREAFPGARMVGGVGSPGLRRRLVEKATAAGFGFRRLVHPGIEPGDGVEIGEGAVVCAGCILTIDIRVGAHAQVNVACTLAHDVVLGDFATLAPGVHVAGCVHVGAGAYIGTGANIINGTAAEPLVIGAGAVVGAGACVVRPVAPGATVVGVPARSRV
jgi:sugar O-acyltransferase (sialic acid O-acetyltransferase NeuD family)